MVVYVLLVCFSQGKHGMFLSQSSLSSSHNLQRLLCPCSTVWPKLPEDQFALPCGSQAFLPRSLSLLAENLQPGHLHSFKGLFLPRGVTTCYLRRSPPTGPLQGHRDNSSTMFPCPAAQLSTLLTVTGPHSCFCESAQCV